MLQIVSLLSIGDGSPEVRARYFEEAGKILRDHGGSVISTSRPAPTDPDNTDVVHIIQFDDKAGFEAFRTDPRHELLREQRIAAIRTSRLFFTDEFVTYID